MERPSSNRSNNFLFWRWAYNKHKCKYLLCPYQRELFIYSYIWNSLYFLLSWIWMRPFEFVQLFLSLHFFPFRWLIKIIQLMAIIYLIISMAYNSLWIMEHPPPLLVQTQMVITIWRKLKKTKHDPIKLDIYILILNLQLIHESFLYTFQVLKQLHVDLTISQIAPLLSSQVDYQVIFKTMLAILPLMPFH